MTGHIFEIKRFAVHDGDGIRTTVFLKGCPLRCVWCHNPEGLMQSKQLAFYAHKCVSCGACSKVCPAHQYENGIHTFHRDLCTACGRCEEVCPAQALKLYGEEMSVDEVLSVLLEDKDFYENSGGGITLSGGECLLQPAFCRALLSACHENGLHTAVDTCGYVAWESIEAVLPFTDIFLYDLKAFDEAVHLRATGVSNQKILENLKRIDKLGKPIEIRIPFVPSYNGGEMERLADFIGTLKEVKRVRILPYHNYAKSKYSALGMEDTMPDRLPTEEELNTAKGFFAERGIPCI